MGQCLSTTAHFIPSRFSARSQLDKDGKDDNVKDGNGKAHDGDGKAHDGDGKVRDGDGKAQGCHKGKILVLYQIINSSTI